MPTPSKLLTIVVPTYNMEKYLRRCLDSLIVSDEQMQMLEVLVINDGSKDSSSQIAHEYQDRYPQTFRAIDKENGNYGSCVNRGLDEATGKYFRLLDADDQFDKEGLVKVLQVLATTEAGMVVTPFCRIYEGKEEERHYRERPQGIEYGKIYDASTFDFIERGCSHLLAMHTVTYRTAILREVNLRLQTGISYTDTEYVYFPLRVVRRILFIDVCLYVYTCGREGQTVSPAAQIKGIKSYYTVGNRVWEDFKTQTGNKLPCPLRSSQLVMIERVFGSYFMANICLTKRGPEEVRMKALYEDLKANAPETLALLRTRKYRKIFHYFKIWERGKYLSEFPYSAINGLISCYKRL